MLSTPADSLRTTGNRLIPFVVNGIVIGSIYAIVALGIVLVYKGSRVVNFAHGEMGMIAAFIVLTLWVDRGWPFLVAAGIGVLASAAAGWTTERLIVRPLSKESRLTLLVATLGVAGVLHFVGVELWGLDPRFIPPPLTGRGFVAGQIVLPVPRIVVIAAALVLSLLLFLLFRRTSFGRVFEAVAMDADTAKLMGINVRRVSSITWTLGAALSGISAILVAPLVSFHVFFMTLLTIRAFAASLIAGLTDLRGAFGAGLFIGVAESVLSKYTSQPGMVEVALFLLILMVLALRRSGVEGQVSLVRV